MPQPDPGLPPSAARFSALLLTALDALAKAGDAETACQLAGRACALTRQNDAAEWRRYNVLLHRLIRQTGPVGDHPPAGSLP